MRHLILAAVLALLGSFSSAGEYTITTTAAQDARFERHRLRLNAQTCTAAQLPVYCTQAQARLVNPDANIFGTIEELLDKGILTPYSVWLKTADTQDDAQQAAALWALKTDAQKNAVCSAIGLPAGCEAWPR
jgi:hypothetical protein